MAGKHNFHLSMATTMKMTRLRQRSRPKRKSLGLVKAEAQSEWECQVTVSRRVNADSLMSRHDSRVT